MDAQLGRVIAELDQLGLASNTIIILGGDHSIWCKHTNHEQAARIPLPFAASGAKAGARSGSLVETVDLYPTLCELAASPRPLVWMVAALSPRCATPPRRRRTTPFTSIRAARRARAQ